MNDINYDVETAIAIAKDCYLSIYFTADFSNWFYPQLLNPISMSVRDSVCNGILLSIRRDVK